ncbi:MAG: FimV/HubP family polar landmark protein [Pseudomonadota bacterium]
MNAVTLGQIKVGSLLGEPLKATIEIKADNPEQVKSLKVNLASFSEFNKSGIPRSGLLDSLRFRVIARGAASGSVLVTSDRPIREPFLDFLVKAEWSTGQVVREYTLLLDPPFTGAGRAPVIDVPVQTVQPKPLAQPRPAARPRPVARTEPAARPEPVTAPEPVVRPKPRVAKPAPAISEPGPEVGVGEIAVRAKDTMWTIASRVRPAGATVQQTIAAIYATNPDAFLRGNINLVKKGALLRIPSKDEILGVEAAAANALMAEHSRAWKSRSTVTPSSLASLSGSTPSDDAGEVPVEAETAAVEAPSAAGESLVKEQGELPPGELRLASASSSDDATAAVDDSLSPASGEDVLIAREEAASARQEAGELRDRLSNIEEQLSDAMRLLELQNQELARLQAYYAQLDVRPPESGQQISAAAGQGPADAATAPVMPSGGEPVDSPVEEPVVPPTGDSVPAENLPEQSLAVEEPDADEQKPAAAELPAASVESAETTSGMPTEAGSGAGSEGDTLWGAFKGWFVAGGVLLLALVGWLLARGDRRNRRADPGDQASMEAEPGSDVPGPRDTGIPVDEHVAAVNALIASGDYADATAAVGRALEEHPGDATLRVKRLEVLEAAGDREAFAAAAQHLAATGFAVDYPDSWQLVETMGRALVPDHELFRETRIESTGTADDAFAEALEDLEKHLGRDAPKDSRAMEAANSALQAGQADSPVADETPEGGSEEAKQDSDGINFNLDFLDSERGDAAKAGEPESPGAAVASTEPDRPYPGSLSLEKPESAAGEAAPADSNVVPLHSDEVVETEADADSEQDMETKLDLAKAFLDLDDSEGARGLLEEVLAQGNDAQKERAASLLGEVD